jgi:hypothetical protein
MTGNVAQPPEPYVRASDADRDRVVEILGHALAEGRLTVQEHSERLDAVYAAKTLGELEPLTRDLVPTSSARPDAAVAPLVDPSGASERQDRMVAVFGGVQRRGRWRVRRRTNAVAVFGGIDLDMNDATFDGSVVEFRLFTLFGGVSIRVPDGVEVRDESSSVFGGVSVDTGDSPPPSGAPVVVLKGLTIFGGVDARRGRNKGC